MDAGAVDRPHRHVLEPGAIRILGPLRVLGDGDAVVVVLELVVVPHRDERVRGVTRLEQRVGPVQLVLGAVAGEVVDRSHGILPDRCDGAPAGLVDVVAEPHDGVDVLRDDSGPGVVPPRAPVLAARKRETQTVGRRAWRREGTGAADRAREAADGEPVPVRPVGGEPTDQHLGRPVGRSVDGHLARFDDRAHGGIGGDFPRHGRGARGQRGLEPGPEHDLAGAVETRQHTEGERGAVGRRVVRRTGRAADDRQAGPGQPERARPTGSSAQEPAPVHLTHTDPPSSPPRVRQLPRGFVVREATLASLLALQNPDGQGMMTARAVRVPASMRS